MPRISESTGLIWADWPAPANVHALATTRQTPGHSLAPWARCNLGLNTGEAPETVNANRAQLARLIDLPSIAFLQQVHGTAAVAAGKDGAVADACHTARAGVACAILTADCLPLLLCSRDGQEVGAAHCGWRGLCAGVIEANVRQFAAPPGELMAWLGPAIGPAAYEVGAEVRQAFLDHDGEAAHCFSPSPNQRWLADLYGLARQRLHALGVKAVHGGTECTFSDSQQFYSWRRDGAASGRQATLIWRRD